MPRLNSNGDYCAGVGGGVVSVNRQVVLPYQSGGANWINDDLVIAQVCDGEACRLETWNRLTGAVVPVSEKGANHIEANGGVWAAWLGSNPATGVYSSTGLSLPQSGLGPVGPDGAIAIKADYQSAGPWDVIERDGTRWRLTDGDAGNINLLGNRRAVWSEPGGVIAACGLVAPIVLSSPFYWLTVTEIDGAWWVLYQASDGRLLFHPFDSSLGYVVTSGNTFRPDVSQLPNGKIRIVWALSEGEPPADVRVRDLALTDARVELRTDPVSDRVVAVNRPLWFGFFTFGATSGLPGNCSLSVRDLFLRADSDNTLLAQYVAAEAEGTFDALQRAIATARTIHKGLPVIAYWPRSLQGGPLPSADYVGVEAYCGAGESLKAFESRMRDVLARCGAVALVAQGYTSNDSLTSNLAALVPVYARLARDCRNIQAVLVFSAGSRATGWSDHPEIHAPWATFAAGLTDPTLPKPVPRFFPQAKVYA